jgi:Mlc titration factor MtfA (ptsG expression regulator)
VVAMREVMDEDGIVHAYDETLSGEAMEGGPVMLSWRDVAEAGESAAWGYNVVIHEFAHVLDMRTGSADGVPQLPDAAARDRWARIMSGEYQRFCQRVDAGRDTLLDPYGATSEAEFFAVASEHFFVTPDELAGRHRALYSLLASYYMQDPAAIGLLRSSR